MDRNFYNPFAGKPPHQPFSEKGYCIFEVLSSGTWYKVDMKCLRPEFYHDVPEAMIGRIRSIWRDVIIDTPAGDFRVDPAPYYEEALREEFDDVRFLGSDFVPGVVC